jgi:hypothetical protein
MESRDKEERGGRWTHIKPDETESNEKKRTEVK